MIRSRARGCLFAVALAIAAAASPASAGRTTEPARWRWLTRLAATYPDEARSLREFRTSLEHVLPERAFVSSALDRDVLVALLVRGVYEVTDRESGRPRFPGWFHGFFDLRPLADPGALRAQRAANLRRLGELFSRLGPGYEKLAQFLGNRPDLVAPALRARLAELSEHSAPVPRWLLHRTLLGALGFDPALSRWQRATLMAKVERREPLTPKERELWRHGHRNDARPHSDALDAFEAFLARSRIDVVGTGSIAVALRITPPDGRPLIAKVLKPGVADRLRANFDTILDTLRDPGTDALRAVLAELREQTLRETDLVREGAAIRRAARALAPFGIEVPPPLIDGVTAEVLLLEPARGASVGRGTRRIPVDQRPGVAARIFAGAVRAVLEGQAHGDPHRGNVFVAPRSGAVSFIDWGLTAELSGPQRARLFALALAAHERDPAALEQTLSAWARRGSDPAVLRTIIDDELAAGHDAIATLQRILLRYQLGGGRLPGAVVMTVKGLAQAEGVARELDPDFSAAGALASVWAEDAPAAAPPPPPRRLADLWLRDAFRDDERRLASAEAALADAAQGRYWGTDLGWVRSLADRGGDPHVGVDHPYNQARRALLARARPLEIEWLLMKREEDLVRALDPSERGHLVWVEQSSATLNRILSEPGAEAELGRVIAGARFRRFARRVEGEAAAAATRLVAERGDDRLELAHRTLEHEQILSESAVGDPAALRRAAGTFAARCRADAGAGPRPTPPGDPRALRASRVPALRRAMRSRSPSPARAAVRRPVR